MISQAWKAISSDRWAVVEKKETKATRKILRELHAAETFIIFISKRISILTRNVERDFIIVFDQNMPCTAKISEFRQGDRIMR